MPNIKIVLLSTLFFLLVAAPASSLEMTQRQIKLGPELTMVAANKAAETLFKLDSLSKEPIFLMIGIRKGYAPAMMVVIDAINVVRSKVYAVIQAEALGVGAVIALFCNKAYAFAHASILFKKLEYDAEKTMKEAPPLPVEAANSYLDRLAEKVAKKLNMSRRSYDSKVEKGLYMTSNAARKAGIITDVVDRVKWLDLVTETIEIKRTSTVKEKRPLPRAK